MFYLSLQIPFKHRKLKPKTKKPFCDLLQIKHFFFLKKNYWSQDSNKGKSRLFFWGGWRKRPKIDFGTAETFFKTLNFAILKIKKS